jgi:hypothetical protein
MPKVSLPHNHWQSLGDMGFESKAFYQLLYQLADCAGVVGMCLEDISGIAHRQFRSNDLNALGALVIRLDENTLLLPHYLRDQNSSLTDTCKKHQPYLRAIHRHWGHRRPDGTEPVFDAWEKLGIAHKLPVFNDAKTKDGKLPKWLKKHRELAEAAREIRPPSHWEQAMIRGVRSFMEHRYERAMDQATHAGCREWAWSPSAAKSSIGMASGWLEERHKPHRIGHVFHSAAIGGHKSPLHPNPRRDDHKDES